MNNLNYEKLILARQLLGLSQKKLAEETGVSQSTLSKIEKGDLIPSEDTLTTIMKVLGFPKSFLMTSNHLGGVSALSFHAYRKKASVPIYKVNKILAEITIKTEHQEKLVNREGRKIIDFKEYVNLTDKELAHSLRKLWKIGNNPITNLTKHIEDMGIDIFLCDFADAQVDGVTSKGRNGLKAIFINKNQPGDRYRFSLAHELCHYLKHSNEPICNKEMEDEANSFAAELLMPEDELKSSLHTTRLIDYAELKKYWKVSMAALIFRAKTLGCITPNQSTSLWKQMAMHGFRKVEPYPIELEQPKQVNKLLKELSGGKLNNLLNELDLTTETFELLYKDFYEVEGKTLN